VSGRLRRLGLCTLVLAVAAVLAGAAACGSGQAPAAPTPVATSATPAVTYLAGQTYFGRNSYIEFHAGELPIVLSAPHGGSLEPAEIPNRTSGTTLTDSAAEDLARAVADALQARTGREAHLVVCRLKRSKLDANRDVAEGAQGNPAAEQAWREYHGFLETARSMAASRYGRALVVDIHGHGHPKARVEVGYLLSAIDLDRPDGELDDPPWSRQSSIRTLAAECGLPFSALLRGPASFGGLIERAGYLSVPGPTTPGPGSDPYFDGGYITSRHGSVDGGPVSAFQVETPWPGVRDTASARSRFATAMADALVAYLAAQFRIPL